MDLAQERVHLQDVDRNIALGEQRLIHQRSLVEQAQRNGNASADQTDMLVAMENGLEALRNLRGVILETIARLEAQRGSA